MQHIVDKKLQDLACPVSLFVPITGGLIGRTRLTQALQGEKPLDHNVVEKLVALLDEMARLKNLLPVEPSWTDAENWRKYLTNAKEIKS